MLELFLTFARIGLFTFGGGYAMIAVIEDICCEKKKWITHDEMMELIVIAESTPGPIAINCATYVGRLQKGFWGAVAATLGMVAPSFGIIYAISLFLQGFLEIGIIANAFRGIRVGVGVVILNAGVNMWKKAPGDVLSQLTLIGAFAVMLAGSFFGRGISSILLMVLAGILSLAVFAVRGGKKA